MVPLLSDLFQKLSLHFLLFCSLLHLGTVFINIHVFICMPEQTPHRGILKITRQCISRRIADRHCRMKSGIFFRLPAYRLQAFFHFCMIDIRQHCKKFIPTITSGKILLRDCKTHLLCKTTDIFISLIMSEIVVDRP